MRTLEVLLSKDMVKAGVYEGVSVVKARVGWLHRGQLQWGPRRFVSPASPDPQWPTMAPVTGRHMVPGRRLGLQESPAIPALWP